MRCHGRGIGFHRPLSGLDARGRLSADIFPARAVQRTALRGQDGLPLEVVAPRFSPDRRLLAGAKMDRRGRI